MVRLDNFILAEIFWKMLTVGRSTASGHQLRSRAAMPTTRRLGERTQVRPTSPSDQPIGTVAANQARIFILSDVRLYREGLAWSLSQRPEVEMIGAAAPSEGALAEIVSSAPTAVLLDFAMPEALNLPKELNRLIPGVKVIAFAASEVDHELIACAEAGIAGFVTRDASVDDLVASIRNALRGEVVCSARIAGLLFQRVAALSEPKHGPSNIPPLTRREREVAVLVNEGMSNKEIARSLQIGFATVKNHVHNILEKLQVSRRGDAAAILRGDILGRRSAQSCLTTTRDFEVIRTRPKSTSPLDRMV
jgi:two-component system nitrate/nitrite response regulator NarL